MKRLAIVLLVCLTVLWAGDALAMRVLPPEIEILTMQPGTPVDIDLVTPDTITLPGYGPFVLHVGIQGGIAGLRIVVPGNITQYYPLTALDYLFNGTSLVHGQTIDLSGANIPFCTPFLVRANFDLTGTTVTPTAAPIPSGLILLSSGLFGVFGLARKGFFFNKA